MNRWSTEDFEGSENTLYDATMMDTCHCTFAQTCGMYSTKSGPYCELWTWGDSDLSMQVHQLPEMHFSCWGC